MQILCNLWYLIAKIGRAYRDSASQPATVSWWTAWNRRGFVAPLTFVLLPTVAAATYVLGASPLSQQVARWELVGNLRIGSVDEPGYDLSGVTSLAVDGRGRVFVGQPHDGSVWVYDDEGAFLKKIGSSGEGPGEFQNVNGLGFLGDTLWVSDKKLARVSLFDPDTGYLRSFRIGLAPGRGFAPTPPTAMLTDGRIVADLRIVQAVGPDSVPTVVANRNGQIQDTLFSQSVRKDWLIVEHGKWTTYSAYQPLEDIPLWAASTNGQHLVAVFRPASLPEDGESRFRVVSFGMADDTLFDRAYSFEPVEVSDQTIDSLVAWKASRAVESWPGEHGDGRRLRQSIREALYVPPIHPPVTDLMVDRAGRIWLQRDRQEWWVLDANDGRLLARVVCDEEARLLDGGRGEVWGLTHAEFDLPNIVRFTIRERE